jgi:hypothetical protein
MREARTVEWSRAWGLMLFSVGLFHILPAQAQEDTLTDRAEQGDDRIRTSLLPTALLLTQASTALASTTWYVNGVSGSDNHNCRSSQTACKTIGHAVSLTASGDSIRVAAATYAEHITIASSLNLIGSGASTTIIDGGRVIVSTVGSVVSISNVTIRNGRADSGAGVLNRAILTINNSTVSGNRVFATGGGISNFGTLTLNNSTVSGNIAECEIFVCSVYGDGGGIINNGGGTLTINNSTIAGNMARSRFPTAGGGVLNNGILTISNSTVSGNSAHIGGGIFGIATLQNSILANNGFGGNCHGSVSSIFSLSSDNTCDLDGPGDLNNTDPKLGTLGYYGGPTQTIPLLSGSPAIDAGNPSGCTDQKGHLLKTDQRGLPRPDKEDKGGCDMGAYESQRDQP